MKLYDNIDVRTHLTELPTCLLVDKLMTVYNRLEQVKGNFPFGQPSGRVDKITIESMMGDISDQFEGVW